MKPACRTRLIDINFFATRDWTLYPSLYAACKSDALRLCNSAPEWFHTYQHSEIAANTLPCLFFNLRPVNDTEAALKAEHVSPGCEVEVLKVLEMRSSSIELLPNVQMACRKELVEVCSGRGVAVTEKGVEIKCLQIHFEELGEACQSAIGKLSDLQERDIRLDREMYERCMPLAKQECIDKMDFSEFWVMGG